LVTLFLFLNFQARLRYFLPVGSLLGKEVIIGWCILLLPDSYCFSTYLLYSSFLLIGTFQSNLLKDKWYITSPDSIIAPSKNISIFFWSTAKLISVAVRFACI